MPGHEVGEVTGLGPAPTGSPQATGSASPGSGTPAARAGWCRSGRENLCEQSQYTGWDADGGYAEFAVVPEGFAYRMPDAFADEQAPLLCAASSATRSLLRSQLPPGAAGIYGFGASAHLTAQVAIAQGAEVHVMTRGAQARDLARELGAASVGGPRILRRAPGLRDHLRPSRRPGAARTRVARPCGDVGAGRHPHERHPTWTTSGTSSASARSAR